MSVTTQATIIGAANYLPNPITEEEMNTLINSDVIVLNANMILWKITFINILSSIVSYLHSILSHLNLLEYSSLLQLLDLEDN